MPHMYIITSFTMPAVFQQRMPFPNAAQTDRPLYDSSFAIFDVGVSIEPEFSVDKDSIKFEGFIPYVNTRISNTHKEVTLRGKRWKESVCFASSGIFKVDSAWGHKALFLFNSSAFTSKDIRLIEHGGRLSSRPGCKKLVAKGDYRDLNIDFVHPWYRNKIWAINIHRGPNRTKLDWNKSLGCVTVDPLQLDTMMKHIAQDEVCMYIHRIDDLVRTPGNQDLKKIKNVDHDMIDLLYRTLVAQMSAVRGE